MENRAIISVHSKVPRKERVEPNRYLGVVELVGEGFRLVEVALPFGVPNLPECPYIFTASCEDTFVEMRKGKLPLLQIQEWRPMEHFYM